MTFSQANAQAFKKGELTFKYGNRTIATWNPKTGETLSGLKRATKVTVNGGGSKNEVQIPDNATPSQRARLRAEANKKYGKNNWVLASTTTMKQDMQNAQSVKSQNKNTSVKGGTFQSRVNQATTQKKKTQQQARVQERKNHITVGDTSTGVTVTAAKSRLGNRTDNTGWVPVDISSWEGFKDNSSTNPDGSPALNNARVWQNMQTGEYRVADNKGNIIGSAFSEEQAKKAAFDHYNIYSDKQLSRNMAADERGKEVRESSKDVEGYNPSKELLAQVVQNQHRGLEYTAAAINKGLRLPLAAGWGALRVVADPNYTLKNWYTQDVNPLAGTTEDLLQGNSGAGDVVVGVGSRFGVNPDSDASQTLRLVGNMAGDVAAGSLLKSNVSRGQNRITGNTSFHYKGPVIGRYYSNRVMGQIRSNGLPMEQVPTGRSINGRLSVTYRNNGGQPTIVTPEYTGNWFQRTFRFGPTSNHHVTLNTDMNPVYIKKSGGIKPISTKRGYIWYHNQGYRPFVEGNVEVQPVVIPTLPHAVPTIAQQPVETLEISAPGALYKPADNYHRQQYLTGEILPTDWNGGTQDLQDRSRVLNNGQVRLGLDGNGTTYSTGVFYGPSQYE